MPCWLRLCCHFLFVYSFPRQSILEEVTSPVIKTNLERKLTVKSKELSTFKEKCHKLESKEMGLKSHCEKLEKLLEAKEEAVAKVMTERDILERDMAHYITEVNVSFSISCFNSWSFSFFLL